MPYVVLLGPKAERAFRTLREKDKERIREALLRLEEDPTTPRPGADIKRLRGTQRLWRLRMGAWRAIYGIDGQLVIVTDIFPRSKGYDV